MIFAYTLTLQIFGVSHGQNCTQKEVLLLQAWIPDDFMLFAVVLPISRTT